MFNFNKSDFKTIDAEVEIVFKYSRSNPEKVRTLLVHKCDDKYVEGYEVDGDVKRYKKFLVEFMTEFTSEEIDKNFIDLTI